ncbi:LOW QUALITY PROTEIN: patatin-like phospholipase domain-containing protein 5 [Megaptera novaeangliae]
MAGEVMRPPPAGPQGRREADEAQTPRLLLRLIVKLSFTSTSSGGLWTALPAPQVPFVQNSSDSIVLQAHGPVASGLSQDLLCPGSMLGIGHAEGNWWRPQTWVHTMRACDGVRPHPRAGPTATSCFETEGSWSLCFAGAGFPGLYHVGVTRGASRFYGSSSGALDAASIACGKSTSAAATSFMPTESIRQLLQDKLPAHIHILASQWLGISLTRWPDADFIVTEFATCNEVIQETTQGTQKVAWICAEPLRSKLGALGLWRYLCSHMGAPESLLDGALDRALKKACLRDPRTWASFCQTGPGWVLTYLLLPCTLPFEHVYFRSRRAVAWPPDMPADLRWMRGLLRNLVLRVYSRTKDQLLGPGSLLVTSPLQPEAAPPTDLAREPSPARQA